VVVASGAVVFCGPSGRGKSTLALHLANTGEPVLAEDGVAIELGPDRPMAWPGPRGIRVADGPGEPKRVRPVPRRLQVSAPSPVIAAVALAARTSGELTVDRLDPVTGARAILASTISTPGPDFADAFTQCARLAERVPVFRARLPDDLDRAQAAAPQLLAQVARAAAA
jgi:energy-coupling factor transporter ATP-binding protein EcfA2